MRFDSITQFKNQVYAAWKWFSSLFKHDWDLSDYPISLRKFPTDASIVNSRLKQHRYSAAIVNWWVMSGGGETQEEALQALQKNFTAIKTKRAKAQKMLPRPGTHVDLEFASRARVDAHSELTDDFVRLRSE
ncbi:MAG TPA: hypothetical protein VGG46_04910 [Terriglobales bacterium]|jgi:hypothetical protein